MHNQFHNWTMILAMSVFSLITCLMAEDKADGRIAAMVNGEPIYENEISMPVKTDNVIGIIVNRVKQIRLERIIRARIISQYLKANKIM